MSKIYFPPKCGYRIEGNRIIADGTVKNKVSGTAMAGILGVSPWTTPFQVACNLLGLAREDISGKPAVSVGNQLEPLIIAYADKVYGPEYGSFLMAEEVYEKREGDHDSWVSDFESETFAGHVDGIVFAKDGENYILEIKTSGDLDSWKDGVPEYYYWQVALYNEFLCKRDHAYVVLGMVNENTYRDYTSWVPNENTVAMFKMDIDQADVQARMRDIEEWYARYILNGETPEFDPDNPGDVEMYEHLLNLSQTKDEIATLVGMCGEIDTQITNAEQDIADLYTLRDTLKNRIKTYLTVHGLNSLNSTDGAYICKIGTQSRSKFDEDAMRTDGIDIDKYKVKSEVKTCSIKKSSR